MSSEREKIKGLRVEEEKGAGEKVRAATSEIMNDVAEDVSIHKPDAEGFVCCPQCGKRLIRKTKSGRFHFIFGKQRGESSPVELYIKGEVRMKCLRHRSCNAWVTIKN